ncbi:peptidoglycan-associated lipoprotein Pal [Methylibium sp.]|jgi:peptidoglycan-associated lipoprotein|uniref:peptidoglycan-associated lipoprotein Pal n=1 Tax=Methylibium sp. TaxID=2067992 RepID=UPI003BABD137
MIPMIRRSTPALAVLAALALAACSSPVKLDEPPVESRTAAPVGGAGAGGSASGTNQSQVANVDLSAQQAGALGKVVYFDFDSFLVKDEFRPIVDNYSKVLNGDRKKRVVIEGHTDERGGREYNLALGQKRAEAVAKSLTLLGVQDAQIESVSYGKERPAVTGSDETAWAKNRRAELRDR